MIEDCDSSEKIRQTFGIENDFVLGKNDTDLDKNGKIEISSRQG